MKRIKLKKPVIVIPGKTDPKHEIPDPELFAAIPKIKFRLLADGLGENAPTATFTISPTHLMNDIGTEIPDMIRAIADTDLARLPAYRAVRQLLIDTALQIKRMEPDNF